MDANVPTPAELQEAFEIALRQKDNPATSLNPAATLGKLARVVLAYREATRLCHIDSHAFDDVNKLWVITTKGPRTINRDSDGDWCFSSSKKAGRVLGAVDYKRLAPLVLNGYSNGLLHHANRADA